MGPLLVGIRVTLSPLYHPQWGPWSIPRSIIPQGHCHQDQRQSEADVSKKPTSQLGALGNGAVALLGKLGTNQPSNNCDSLYYILSHHIISYHILSYSIISCHVMSCIFHQTEVLILCINMWICCNQTRKCAQHMC